jgi:hypothetical protein
MGLPGVWLAYVRREIVGAIQRLERLDLNVYDNILVVLRLKCDVVKALGLYACGGRCEVELKFCSDVDC